MSSNYLLEISILRGAKGSTEVNKRNQENYKIKLRSLVLCLRKVGFLLGCFD